MYGKFGLYLVSTGRISEEALEAAAAFQQEHPYLRVGEILVAQKGISFGTLMEALDEYRAQCKLGQILLMDGHLTAMQLEEALLVQASTGLLLGKILVDLRYCSLDTVLQALSVQRRLQAVA